MEKWEQSYKNWWMANNEINIKNSLDKHSQMTELEFNKRLRDSSQQMYQEAFMRDFIKEMYQSQEKEASVLRFDKKQVKKEVDDLLDTIQKELDKF